jgi:hypothetical protein
MTVRELEGLLKNCLKSYEDDYNRINPNTKVAFNVTFTLHKFIAKESLKDYDPADEKFAQAKALDGKDLYYFRISKTIIADDEKRVIFTAYRPAEAFKKDAAHRAMYLEAIRSLMIGGLEYSEAIYRMNRKEEGQKENQTEPQPKAV